MTETITRPRFEEVVAVTTMNLPDEGLTFNAQRVGPTTFGGLREADYGERFRMPTMPEIVPLVYASLKNQDYDTAKNVVKTLRDRWITGNTAVLYVPDGMFVQDNPEMKNGRILMSQKVLEGKLGSTQEKGVVFSDDRTIRFTPYNYARESQTPLQLSSNTGVVALVGGEENAEKPAKASEHYKAKPYFWALDNVDSPQVRVAGLFSGDFGVRLFVVANGSEYDDDRCSFGVLDDAVGVAPKK
jgi:hypothetical protein